MPVQVLESMPPERDSAVAATPRHAGVASATLSVVFASELRLEIGAGFDAAMLRQVVEVLGDVG